MRGRFAAFLAARVSLAFLFFSFLSEEEGEDLCVLLESLRNSANR